MTTTTSARSCPPQYTGVPDLACLPRWGTPRRPDRASLGPLVGEVSRRLGLPLMPWQQYVVDVALEVDPDTGRLAYSEVGLTVPRQSGKTTLILGLTVHRALGFTPYLGLRQNILYAAQTRNDSRKKFEDEHVKSLQAAKALRKLFRVRMTNGNEAILWANGSKHGITSTTEKAGHGETLDLGVLDEAFSQQDDRVEQAMKPAMVTRHDAQFWWTSTAGRANSLYLLDKVDLGRRTVENDVDRGLCFFEWSADPAADPADPATWRDCMPALGLTALAESVENFQRTMKPAEFRRAFLNIADTEASEEWSVIDEAAWTACIDTASKHTGPIAFAVDVTPDRSHAAIAVAGRRADGKLHVEIVDHRAGISWVTPRLVELVEKWKPCALVVDASGPAGSLVAPLEAAGLEVVKPQSREAAAACGQFYDAVCDAKDLRHLGQAPLTAALSGAQKRPLGDAWAWARKGISVDLSPLVATTLAAWGHATRAHTLEERPVFAPMVAWR